MKLEGNRVLITGGGTGIGLALAASLLERGNRVAICGRRSEKLDEARRQNPGLETHRCDVSLAEDRQRLHESLERDGFEVNVLINNAASMRPYDFTQPDDLDLEGLRQDIAVNFVSPVELVQLFLPGLLRRDDATIINVSSPGGVVPVANVPVYCASKAAINAFSSSLRHQLHGRVKVITLFPPSVDTEMMKGVSLNKVSVDECNREILRRLAKGDDEIWIGEGRYIPILSRLAPKRTFRLVNKMTRMAPRES